MVLNKAASNRDEKEGGEACELPKSEVVSNGYAVGHNAAEVEGSPGESEFLRTYKRRKAQKSASDGQGSEKKMASLEADEAEKKLQRVDTENSCDNVTPNVMNGTQDDKLRHWRNAILADICSSVEDGSFRRCIRDAMLSHSDNQIDKIFKWHFETNASRPEECPSLAPDGSTGAVNHLMDAVSNGSSDEGSHQTISERCQDALYDVITSEKFALLCKLLLENFQGLKDDNLFGLNLMNARMKEEAYESSPQLFYLDIQKVWRNLRGIGTAMVSLANSLSEISRTSYNELVGSPVPSISEGGNREVSDTQTAAEQIGASDPNSMCICKSCLGKADGKDCLVCDSCEEMYHVSCIEPAIKEIPSKSWYCTSCTAKGIGSPHAHCVVCERMNATEIQLGARDEEIPENHDDMEDDLGCGIAENFSQCKICGVEVSEDGFRVCSHPFCPHRYYHEHCMTARQLKAYGPRWYCPSCLCTVCLTDKDDSKIVLCDGCDHAYHTYCMKPPCASIPSGNWFCVKCDAGIQEIKRVRLAYEKHEKGGASRKYDENKANGRKREVSDQGREGMDMLLSAAKTLNSEENLDAGQRD